MNSLEHLCEAAAIEILECSEALITYRDRDAIVHHDEQNELELPAIVVKATEAGLYLNHPTDPARRIYNVNLEIEFRGVIGQTAANPTDLAFAAIEAAFGAINVDEIAALGNFNFFSLEKAESNERTIEGDQRARVKKFTILAQLKQA